MTTTTETEETEDAGAVLPDNVKDYIRSEKNDQPLFIVPDPACAKVLEETEALVVVIKGFWSGLQENANIIAGVAASFSEIVLLAESEWLLRWPVYQLASVLSKSRSIRIALVHDTISTWDHKKTLVGVEMALRSPHIFTSQEDDSIAVPILEELATQSKGDDSFVQKVARLAADADPMTRERMSQLCKKSFNVSKTTFNELVAAARRETARAVAESRRKGQAPLTMYYCPNGRGKDYYYVDAETGFYVPVDRIGAQQYCVSKDLSAGRGKEETCSEVEQFLVSTRSLPIDYVGSVPGYRLGCWDINGSRILVTKQANFIEPKKGKTDTVMKMTRELFGPELQVNIALGWLQDAVRYLYAPELAIKHHQALYAVGAVGDGKGVWFNQIVAPVLGGRTIDPSQWIFGATEFNEDFLDGELLLGEDSQFSLRFEDRVTAGERIKQICVNETHRIHPKGLKAMPMAPFWRMAFTLNDHPPEVLMKIPPLSHVGDKIIILKTASADLSFETIDKWKAAVRSELPAFVHFLLNDFVLPEAYRDPKRRFPVMSYHNPEIETLVRDNSDEALLLFVLRRAYAWDDTDGESIAEPAAKIAQRIQNAGDVTRQEKEKFNNEITIGKILSRVEKTWPNDIATFSRTGGNRKWTIKLNFQGADR